MTDTYKSSNASGLVVWRSIAFVLATALASIVLLNGYGLLVVPGLIDHTRAGSWGDLIAAFGTVGAVSVALYSSLREAQKTRELARELLFEKRLAKTRVYAWLEPEHTNETYNWKIRLRNDLDAPIYNWVVDLADSQSDARSEDLGPIFPGSTNLIVKSLRGRSPTQMPRIMLRFESPDGQWWQRDDRGELSPAVLSRGGAHGR
jgi:hypothetical protein